MELKKIGLGLIAVIVILAVAGALISGGEKEETTEPANFEVSNLSLSSSEISPGETVTASVDVKNTGGKSGTKMVEFNIGEETKTRDVTLGAGESDEVSISVTKQEEGTFDVNISGLSESFEVVKPGKEFIEPDDLSGLKAEVAQIRGESVEWIGNLRIMNLDEKQNLKVRTDSEDETVEGPSKYILNREFENAWVYLEEKNLPENFEASWFILPGEGYANAENSLLEMRNDIIKNVPENWKGEGFTIEGEEIRLENIEVNPDFSEGVFVIEDYQEIPTFEVSGLNVEPSEVEPGQTVTVSAVVTNIKDTRESYTVELSVDGVPEKTETVELGFNEAYRVGFEVTRDIEGTYEVSIGNLTGSFEVVEPTPEPINLQASGDTSTETFTLVKGLSIFYFKHDGSSNFIVELMNAETGETAGGLQLPNVIGSFEGSTIVGVTGEIMQTSPGEYLLNITADGNWEVTIEQPRPTSASGTPQTFSGKGWKATEPFELEKGTARFEMSHNGSRNFIVTLYDKDGKMINQLVNEIGSYEGSKTVGVTGEIMQASPGIHYLGIIADGDWEIKITQ